MSTTFKTCVFGGFDREETEAAQPEKEIESGTEHRVEGGTEHRIESVPEPPMESRAGSSAEDRIENRQADGTGNSIELHKGIL